MNAPATLEHLALVGVEVEHYFGGGAYIKSTSIPAGRILGQHVHAHDHLSVLVSGTVRLWIDGVPELHSGYETLLLPAHRLHVVEAITDCIWLCVWAIDKTDPFGVDNAILAGEE